MKRLIRISVCCIMMFLMTGCTNSEIEANNKAIGKKIKELEAKQQISINELTEFDWDKVYNFRPYLAKEEIERILGFSSEEITDTMIDENIVSVVFVKDDKVVCNISQRAETLGYDMDFMTMATTCPTGDVVDYVAFTKEEKAMFRVDDTENIRYLKYLGMI